MNQHRVFASFLGGLCLVAIAAFLGGRDGYPTLWSTLCLPSVLLLWPLGLPPWVFSAVSTLIFAVWAYPYNREKTQPKRSLFLGCALGLSSIAYFIYGHRYAVEYQGAVYFWVIGFFSLGLFTTAMWIAAVAFRRKVRWLQILADALLFSWSFWLAFPYMGELP